MIKVAKFGGSSLADENCFSKVAAAVANDEDIKVIVVSAGGKISGGKKVTDTLLSAWDDVSKGKPLYLALLPFYERIALLIEKLQLNFNVDLQEIIERGFEKDRTPDFLLSRGEYAYSLIAANYLGKRWVDASSIIKFDKSGKLNLEFSRFLIREEFSKGDFLTGGFYGSFPDGKIKIFERGGGDLSGAIIASAIADEYLNFTDVNGIYDFDPKSAPSKVIPRISFENARKLAEFGASVLHPDSVLPLVGTGIPIRVKNTFDFRAQGTTIEESCTERVFCCSVMKDCLYLELTATGRGYMLSGELSKFTDVICSAADKDSLKAVVKAFSGGEDVIKNISVDRAVVKDGMVTACVIGDKTGELLNEARRNISCVFICENQGCAYICFYKRYMDDFVEFIKKYLK